MKTLEERLIDRVYRFFSDSGTWPYARELDREFAGEGELEEICKRIGRNYILCGGMWYPEARCSLTLQGVRLATGSTDDLENLIAVIPLFEEKFYEGSDVTRAEAVLRLRISVEASVRLFELLHISPLINGGSGSGGTWDQFGISPVIRKYRKVKTIAEFFEIYEQAIKEAEAQLQAATEEEDKPDIESLIASAVAVPEGLLSDAALQQNLETDLRELNACATSGAWKAVGLLAGSCCEAILIDLLQRDPTVIPAKRQDQWQDRLGLRELAEVAQTARLISPESRLLIAAMKRWRDLVHPWRAVKHQIPTGTSARAMLTFLDLLIADVRVANSGST